MSDVASPSHRFAVSIETRGPEAYDRQYRMAVLLALLGLRAGKGLERLVIEKEGGEDIELEFAMTTSSVTTEVQVKTTTTDLDLTSLAEVFSHFPSHSAKDCLLSRVLKDDSRRTLLVTSARATDAVRGFVRPRWSELEEHASDPISATQMPAFAQAFESLYPGDKALAIERRAACVELAKEIRAHVANSRRNLRRAVVWEQVDDADVRHEAERLLVREFSIPLIEVAEVLTLLTEEVRKVREQRGDALPGIRRVLHERRLDRLADAFHVTRPDESDLSARFANENFLAITGRPNSGKTHLAREMLESLQKSGWRCTEVDSVEAAIRFLGAPDSQERACLLDDPLEHDDVSRRARTLERLRQLPDFCRPSRRVIVTARLETLHQLEHGFTPNQMGPGDLVWRDTTVSDRAFLEKLWRELAGRSGTESRVVEIVAGELARMRPADLLQPGQLRHLARVPPSQCEGKSKEQLVAMARVNARALASALGGLPPVHQRVARALAIAALSIEGTSAAELAFVLSSKDIGPGWSEDLGVSMFGSRAPEFPSYETLPALSVDEQSALNEMERRGYVRVRDDRYVMAHPDYTEAFSLFFAQWAKNRPQEACAEIQRGLSALAPAVGTSAIRALARAWDTADARHQPELRDLALQTFEQSIFPSVQEAALQFLLKTIVGGPAEAAEKTLASLVYRPSTDSELEWHGEVPWLDRHPESDRFLRHAREHRDRERSEVVKICERLLDPTRVGGVRAIEMDAVNTFYLQHDDAQFDADAVKRIALCEYSFIRADAAALLCSGRVAFDSEIAKLFFDEDPRVASRAVQTCIERWRWHTAERSLVHDSVLRALAELPVAVLTSRFLFDFGDVHSSFGAIDWNAYSKNEHADLWAFWAECMGAVLRTVAPYRLEFKDGDLWTSFKAAIVEITDPNRLAEVFGAWVDWIEQRTKVALLSDYSFGVVPLMFVAPHFPAADREAVLRRILALPSTDPVADNLAQLVERWAELTDSERKLVFTLFHQRRPDDRWLRAAALMKECPPELYEVITGRADFRGLDAAEKLAVLSPELLEACIAYVCQRGPGRISLDDASAVEFWLPVWRLILVSPTHPQHLLVVQDLTFTLGHTQTPREDYVAAWAELCRKTTPEQQSNLMKSLVAEGLGSVHARLAECGDHLWDACADDAERARLAAMMAADAEGLDLEQDRLSNLCGRRWANLLLASLPGDRLVWETLRLIEKPERATADDCALLLKIYQVCAPRLPSTHKAVKVLLKRSQVAAAELASSVDAAHKSSLERASQQRKVGTPIHVDAPDWVGTLASYGASARAAKNESEADGANTAISQA